jgi:menaquinone-dependent protoporphyrinogen oxidase
MAPVMPRFLILYATREGQTAKVAARIADHLRQAGAEATLIDAANALVTESLDPGDFDRLVFGASMHAGGLEKELVQFVNTHAEAIRGRPHFLFVVLLSAAATDPAVREEWLGDAGRKIRDQLQVSFDDTEMIAGALSYSKYSFPVKWLMRRLARKAGAETRTDRDYEYTDWEQVRRYAEHLLEAG